MDGSLMELFSNPETIGSLTFGQKMEGSLITMIMGMGLTFLVLIFILVFIKIMGRLMNAAGKQDEPAAKPALQTTAPAQSATKAETAEAAKDETLAAVIAAAIAAYEGDKASNLVVTKITRLNGPQNPWTVSGMNERMETRNLY